MPVHLRAIVLCSVLLYTRNIRPKKTPPMPGVSERCWQPPRDKQQHEWENCLQWPRVRPMLAQWLKRKHFQRFREDDVEDALSPASSQEFSVSALRRSGPSLFMFTLKRLRIQNWVNGRSSNSGIPWPLKGSSTAAPTDTAIVGL